MVATTRGAPIPATLRGMHTVAGVVPARGGSNTWCLLPRSSQPRAERAVGANAE